MTTAIRSLLAADLQTIRRDSLTQFLLYYPLALGILLRFLVPLVQRELVNLYDITPLYPLLTGFFGLLTMPALGGVLIGFLLLDERDQRSLAALQVTPLSMTSYLGYRIALLILMTLIGIFVIIPLMGLVPIDYGWLFVIGMVAALNAPIFAILLFAFASNKVQGLVVMKALSLFMATPFISWFVPEPWQYFFGVLPTFWPLKAFWVQQAGGNPLPYLLIGLGVILVYLVPLLLRFNRIAYRTH